MVLKARRDAGPPFFLNGRAAYFCCWPLSLSGFGVPWFCCGVGAGVAGSCGSESFKKNVIIDYVPNTTGYAHSDNKTLDLSSTDIFFSKPQNTR